MRIVIDTNVLISALFWPNSVLSEKVEALMRTSDVLRSTATYSELSEVASRHKFDRYLPAQQRDLFIAMFYDRTEHVIIDRRIEACRDERDNKFLELAVCGKADCVITGDENLLALDPFEGIRILDLRKFA